jgi:hypothetical protein
VSLQVGDEEVMPRPIAVPNAIKIKETAEATNAPATTGVHCRKNVVVGRDTTSLRSEIVIESLLQPRRNLTKAQKRQDE